MALLTVPEFRARTIMPADDVDTLEMVAPGWLALALEDWTQEIYDRLRKRYTVPFPAPYPRTALRWLTKLVTRDAYHKRGHNPSSAQDKAAIEDPAVLSEAQIKEAADSEKGLYELPLRHDLQTSGVSAGGPFGYSEQGPYDWTDRQVEAVRGG